MKVILNDLTIIMSGTSDEIKKIKKFVTYKDTKNCFFGGKYHPERERDICLGKEVKGYFVCFAGLAKEIFIFARDNKIKIEEFKDNRTHFDFQKKEWTHDELRKFFNPNFKYVEHQIRALQAMLNTNTALVVATTSAGKSSIMSAFIRLSKLPTLILVNKVTLAVQLQENFIKDGIDCGICSGKGVKKGYCMVSTIQSVGKIGDLTKYKCVLGDECFPGKTKVLTENGYKDISWLVNHKSTEKVYSFNKETKETELKSITNWMKKTTEYDEFIKVYFTKSSNNVSTPNHKYYILDNTSNVIMKRADELVVGDRVITYCKKSNEDKSHAPLLNNFQRQAAIGMILGDSTLSINNISNGRLKFSQGEKQLDYLNHKIYILRNLCGNKKPYSNISGYNKNKKIYYKSTKTSCEFYDLYNLFYKNKTKHINNILELITEVSLAYWIMDDGYCYKYNSRIGQRCQYFLETQSFTKEENEKLISFFKERFNLKANLRFDKRCQKYFLSFDIESSIKLSKMIRNYVPKCMDYKLLDCDKGYYKENTESFNNYGYKTIVNIKKVIPENKTVYNITVEDNHNYFVGYNNSLVSNCHNFSASTFQNFLSQYGCPLKYGFSASPFRNGDYLGYARIRQFMGSPVVNIESKELIENKVMAKPYIYIIKNECKEDEYFDYQTAYSEEIVNSKKRNQIVANICEKYGSGVLVLVNLIEHGEILKEMIPCSEFIAGNTSIEDRVKYIKDFDEGRLPILIASTILQEGISITHMKAMVLACSGKSNVAILQKIGRSLRFKAGEKEQVLYYDFFDSAKFLSKHSKMRINLYKKAGYNDIKLVDENLEEIKK